MLKKFLLLIIFLLLILGTFGYFYYRQAVDLSNSDQVQTVPITIDSGEGLSSIAQKLEKGDLIRSAAFFQLYIFLNKLTSSIQAGSYDVPQNLNLKDLVSLLSNGRFDETVTFPEGLRREEMASKIGALNKDNLSKEEFLRLTEGMEGSLFPDTYSISAETTTKDLVQMLRQNFDLKTKGLTSTNLSSKEATTLASLVEREVRFAEDRPIVAGIILNRLKEGMALQVDASVQYALGYQVSSDGWWKKSLSEADLKLESPYNTYINTGLPPTPICNPGLEALKAAFSPSSTGYLYYVSDAEGHLHYARTLDEHNLNVVEFVRR